MGKDRPVTSKLLFKRQMYSFESQCKGKIKYSSKAQAKQVKKNWKDRASKNMRIYLCPWCEHFHLGGRKEGRPPSNRRMTW